MNKTCIIIAGPTAVGKTALAIQLAQHLSTEIISCDSRQCFTELNIGVAKPSGEELQQVPHHFISSHSIHDNVNAAAFEQYALQKAKEIFTTHDTVVMTGGTGLYIKAFCEGMDHVPETDPQVREQIISQYDEKGIGWLQQQLQTHDPVFAERGEMQNPQRMMRALEVVLSTGQSIFAFHSQPKKERPFNIIRIGLELERSLLYNRINKRVDIMMEQGLLKEAELLLPHKNLNALQTVGYRELFDYFEGDTTLDKAVELIKINTRHYAKRQLTWFKRDGQMHWCSPDWPALSKVLGNLK